MKLPGILKSAIQNGHTPIVLGDAFASEATNNKGENPPTSAQLAELLADHFLDGEYRDANLSRVSEYAISEHDPFSVQEFIRETYSGFNPSESHDLFRKIRWSGIATTTVDQYVEKAYESSGSAQTIIPFIDNSDRVSEKLRDPQSVPFLKLHGCVSRTNSEEFPLVLTPEQSIMYRKSRSHLYNMFNDWAREHLIVFLGYDLDDRHFRQVLQDIDSEIPSRPRYYLVLRDASQIVIRHWEKRNIQVLKGSPNEFLKASLEGAGTFQGMGPKIDPNLPISSRFIRQNSAPSDEAVRFLTVEAEYVNSLQPEAMGSAKDFYHGHDPKWFAIQSGWDVRRRVADDIVLEHVLDSRQGDSNDLKLIVIKAHAGAGKSVLLRRIAWDVATEYDRLCLFIKDHGQVSHEAIDEIAQLCDEELFVFIDDAQRRSSEIKSFISKISGLKSKVTIISAARTNEWNVSCKNLSAYVTSEYELTPLSHSEIRDLLKLLEANNALGQLKTLSPEDRIDKLVKGADRQLLVALHEATLGRPFEDIIRDEYDGIRPRQAQKIYLSICVLNRLNIPVRAGIVSRIHGINFDEFKQKFFGPLERVVKTNFNPILRDNTYHARHPEIAQMVFEQVLRDQQEKFTAYKECLDELNVAFDVDETAFKKMIRGRSLLEMFPDHQLVEQLYAVASKQGGSELHLLHQKAIYEMNRPEGNLVEAGRLLKAAIEKDSSNFVVRHSISELQLRLAARSDTKLERRHFLDEAVKVSRQLFARARDSRPYVTCSKALRMKVQDALGGQDAIGNNQALSASVQVAEENIEKGLQRFPGDSFLLAADADLARTLKNSERVLSALNEAFANDPNNGFVGVRLAACLSDLGDSEGAEQTLQQALKANNSNGRIHFAYAKLLLRNEDNDGVAVLAHLRKSFAPGDKNYDAQHCYAAQLYRMGMFAKARASFVELRKVELPFEIRTQIRYEERKSFSGTVSGMESSYGFVLRDGAGDSIYAHISKSDPNHWSKLKSGDKVNFKLGFTMRGPAAFALRLV